MIRSLFIIAILVSVFNNIQAQDTVSTFAEEMPEYPGGKGEMMKHVMKELYYPFTCSKEQIMTKVYVSFTVDKTGKVMDISLSKTSECSAFNEVLLDIFRKMPMWTPGKNKGEPVDVRITYPLTIDYR